MGGFTMLKATDYEDHKHGTLEGLERTHEETLDNGCKIKVTVSPQSHNPKRPLLSYVVISPQGKVVKDKSWEPSDDHWTEEKLLRKGIDEAKRDAGGSHGAPLDDHHQKTPI
jgi:hypothetical protein